MKQSERQNGNKTRTVDGLLITANLIWITLLNKSKTDRQETKRSHGFISHGKNTENELKFFISGGLCFSTIKT